VNKSSLSVKTFTVYIKNYLSFTEMCAMYYLNTGKDAHGHTMLTTKCMYMYVPVAFWGGVYLSTWRVIKSAEL